jgi:hypothetical protein
LNDLGIGQLNLELAPVKESLSNNNIVPFLKLIDKLSKMKDLNSTLFSFQLSNIKEKHSFQIARYDGPLQGTEVGMVLFYTDLLAKLWALDFANAAPNRFISDFKAITDITVSPIYDLERKELPNTRLWFGPQEKGFQYIKKDPSLFFARNATRIFAASSNPLRPGEESEPNALSEDFLSWWDNHYEEVASFEPEYERLNQIIKWSLVISWLNSQGRRDLDFLERVNFKKGLWFPDWVNSKGQLKFTGWDKVGFFARGYKGTTTEAFPILSSSLVKLNPHSGGVSLASKKMFETRKGLFKEQLKIPESSYRSYLDYSSSNIRRISRYDGGTCDFQSLYPNLHECIYKPREKARLRAKTCELRNESFRRLASQSSSIFSLEISTLSSDIGKLSITRNKEVLIVRWENKDVAWGHAVARHLSNQYDLKKAKKTLLSYPQVEAVIEDNGNYFIKRREGNWLKIALEKEASTNIAAGWNSRVAGIKKNSKNFNLAWLKDEDVYREHTKDYIVLDSEGFIQFQLDSQLPKNYQDLTFRYAEETIQGKIDSQNRIYLLVSTIIDRLHFAPSQWNQMLSAKEWQALQKGVSYHNIPLNNFSKEFENFKNQLTTLHHQRLTQNISSDPENYKIFLENHINQEIQYICKLLEQKQNITALDKLDKLIEIYGPLPYLKEYKSTAEIRRTHELFQVTETQDDRNITPLYSGANTPSSFSLLDIKNHQELPKQFPLLDSNQHIILETNPKNLSSALLADSTQLEKISKRNVLLTTNKERAVRNLIQLKQGKDFDVLIDRDDMLFVKGSGVKNSILILENLRPLNTIQNGQFTILMGHTTPDTINYYATLAKDGRFTKRHVIIGLCNDDTSKLCNLTETILSNGAYSVTLSHTQVDIPSFTLIISYLHSHPELFKFGMTPKELILEAAKGVNNEWRNIEDVPDNVKSLLNDPKLKENLEVEVTSLNFQTIVLNQKTTPPTSQEKDVNYKIQKAA